ncbi:hypothetical protein YTPLAS18_17250 [Nitrospira sp.]|nr:hypothetical protein YTPLAS18_17250 [Nitrospira sp.]
MVVSVPPPGFVSEIVFAAGTDPPWLPVKVRDVGVIAMLGVLLPPPLLPPPVLPPPVLPPPVLPPPPPPEVRLSVTVAEYTPAPCEPHHQKFTLPV